ncbi:MAG TPA: hypothetical protein PLN69_03730 [bacterium]|nr:hypothetical protein [bacterium]
MGTLVIILLVVNLCFLAFFVKKWVESAPREQKTPRGGEKPLNEFFTEMNNNSSNEEVTEIAEQLLDRIDRKIDILRQLNREADKQIEKLSQTYHVLPPELPASEPQSRRTRNAVNTPQPEASVPENDNRSKVILLRKRGMGSSEIAQKVNMGRGEVELILRIEGLL